MRSCNCAECQKSRAEGDFRAVSASPAVGLPADADQYADDPDGGAHQAGAGTADQEHHDVAEVPADEIECSGEIAHGPAAVHRRLDV